MVKDLDPWKNNLINILVTSRRVRQHRKTSSIPCYLHGCQVMINANFRVAILVLVLEGTEFEERILMVDKEAKEILLSSGRTNLDIESHFEG